MMNGGKYILITPARNEAANIEKTLQSVVRQTRRPALWVVVNDGSTDETGAIVRRYVEQFDFIRLVESGGDRKANFGSKVKAFNAGYATVGDVEYDWIGNLDGDVSFEADYFDRLLTKYDGAPGLGLAGGIILEKIGEAFEPQNNHETSVAGAVQLFRRACFEQIGGYVSQKVGGIDSIAEIMARMHGWEVRTFPELGVKHHGRVLTGRKSVCTSKFNKGIINYQLGYDPLFQAAQCFFRMTDRPWVIGGVMMFVGYAWSAARRMRRNVPAEMVAFLRNEQRRRLKRMLTGQRQEVGCARPR
jgi:glycosyltransferase involved in cell wall biosynthesis